MLIRIKIIEKIPSPPPNGSHGVERDPGAPTCLRMVAKHYGRNLSAQELREAAEIGKA
jgi:hypothetical protein